MSMLLWTPTAEQIAAARITAFRQFVTDNWHVDVSEYRPLHRWSIEHPQQFWEAVWRFCGIVSSRPWDAAVVDFDRMPGARWFSGARLNYAENLLRIRDERPAIIAWNEGGLRNRLSFRELYEQVARVADALRRWGLKPGDRVAAYMSNVPETVIAMLAATSLGAIWSSCSPDFGLAGALDRFGQIEPRILFAVDGYSYGGKTFETLDRVTGIRSGLPSLEHLVVVPNLPSGKMAELPAGASGWKQLLDSSTAGEVDFEQLPFDHPLYILYSSGTTGRPKCITHCAGGILVQVMKEQVLHIDLRAADRLFYFTTCGWMMWNWLAGGLAANSAIVMYDGSPLAPNPNVLFDLVEQEAVTIFGTSPKFLQAAEKAGLAPARTHDFARLRTLLSTGAPLGEAGFDYVYAKIKPDVRLSSMSGGTDLCSSFATGNPTAPVYRGEMQCRALGMNVLVYDDEGRPIERQKGELVCASPFPSLPLGFWGDPTDKKYHETYFEHYPGVWWHGDFAEITEHDGMVIYGRSDAVLNPGGVRIGTAEIYRQVEQFPEVLESLCIGQQWDGDVRVVLFVKLREGTTLECDLRSRICAQIRRGATPRHVPAKIIPVADIPHTKSGKIVELAVRDLIHGRPVKNAEALANPEALELFRDLPDLLH